MSEAICASCQQPKEQVILKKSRLDPSITLLLCDLCIRQRMEPRWLVIMTGRTYGADRVKEFVKPKRYIGASILLEDLY